MEKVNHPEKLRGEQMMATTSTLITCIAFAGTTPSGKEGKCVMPGDR